MNATLMTVVNTTLIHIGPFLPDPPPSKPERQTVTLRKMHLPSHAVHRDGPSPEARHHSHILQQNESKLLKPNPHWDASNDSLGDESISALVNVELHQNLSLLPEMGQQYPPVFENIQRKQSREISARPESSPGPIIEIVESEQSPQAKLASDAPPEINSTPITHPKPRPSSRLKYRSILAELLENAYRLAPGYMLNDTIIDALLNHVSENGVDCGLFTLLFAYHVSGIFKGMPTDVTSETLDSHRRHFLHCLLTSTDAALSPPPIKGLDVLGKTVGDRMVSIARYTLQIRDRRSSIESLLKPGSLFGDSTASIRQLRQDEGR
ncbi:Ulp1 protease family protein [Colletotrichum orchidophilum]|uniref:Ulp1 protease family protein n=1 Tax=Colletotrichum orchidophilum TaxID=1209926 RepID=A0A1G4BT20_9PEZI|nr:Ulp1 protease family protein [Colletotrichum orchidophilum]OHF04533.1 Ulp1 protease family protein [Colletotrichum orchidophilum]